MSARRHHFAGVYAVNEISLYVDGKLVSSQSHSDGPLTHDRLPDVFIGSGVNGLESFNGAIDEVRLWNVPRSAQEIRAIDFDCNGVVDEADIGPFVAVLPGT